MRWPNRRVPGPNVSQRSAGTKAQPLRHSRVLVELHRPHDPPARARRHRLRCRARARSHRCTGLNSRRPARGRPPASPRVRAERRARAAPLTARCRRVTSDPVRGQRYAIFASDARGAGPRARSRWRSTFDLQERAPGAAVFTHVNATGFGAWIDSQPHVASSPTTTEVTGAAAPAAFRRPRAGTPGSAAGTASCARPGRCRRSASSRLLAPDLVIGRITRAPGSTADTVQYTVEVRNAGNADAGPFQVGLTVGTTALAGIPRSPASPRAARHRPPSTDPPARRGARPRRPADPSPPDRRASRSEASRAVGLPGPGNGGGRPGGPIRARYT